jgi:capsular polysaccharide biosynthesis protein
MSTESLLSALRPWRWLLVSVTIIGAVLGYVVTAYGGTKYEATATVLVGPIFGEIDTLRAATEATPTYAELAYSDPALEAVAGIVRVPAEVLEDIVTVTPNSETRLIQIRVLSDTAQSAAAIGDAVANQLIQQSLSMPPAPISQPPTPVALPPTPAQLSIVVPASRTPAEIPSNAPLMALLAAIVSLVGATALALLFERSRSAVRGPDEFEETSQLPVLATVPASLVRDAQASGTFGYRLLATHLSFRANNSHPQIVAVLGVRDDSTYRSVAANVALALASAGSSVLLSDVGGPPDDSSRIQPTVTLDPAANAAGISVSSWQPGLRPPRVVTVEAAAQHLAVLSRDVDVVVVTPRPLSMSAGSINWVAASDIVLMVVRSQGVDGDQLAITAEAVRLTEPEQAGLVVVQKSPRRRARTVLLPDEPSGTVSPTGAGHRAGQRRRGATALRHADSPSVHAVDGVATAPHDAAVGLPDDAVLKEARQ